LIDFVKRSDCVYKHDYEAIFRDIASGALPEVRTYRTLILNDLFFIVYFVMGVPHANHPFVVETCKEVEGGAQSGTLDIWARGHFKSTVITVAETVQYHLKNPEHCTCIFSYKKPAAEDFLDSVRRTYEKEMMKVCFPDLLYTKPETESPSWSLQNGIVIRRTGTSRKEATIEASGLVEGMLTGKHFERRIYDDIETDDIKDNPEQLDKCYSKFEMSMNLGTGRDEDIERVIGTFYSHAGPLVRIREKERIGGDKMYTTRIKPATEDGSCDGKPVLVSQDMLDKLKMGEHFYSQQLCDPTPKGVRKLDSTLLREIEPQFIPKDVYKFLVIDPAGDDKDGKGDAWAIELWGVEPKADDIGTSNIYLMDAVISPLRHTEAIEEIVRMYMKGGLVQQVGVEKVGQSTTEIHVANALAMKGRHISVENNSLVILRPAAREKKQRIESALAWPLYNSKIFISKAVPVAYANRLKLEMDKFPYWHDDGLDAASYLFDMVKDYQFCYYSDDVIPKYEAVNPLVGY
jgi:hypothetical protein